MGWRVHVAHVDRQADERQHRHPVCAGVQQPLCHRTPQEGRGKASLEGWKSYLTDPAPGNALIKADNPKMSDEQIAFALEQLRALKVLDGGDAQTMGIGIITEARWKATYDFMVAAGLLKPEVDWKQGFTDRYVKSLKLSM